MCKKTNLSFTQFNRIWNHLFGTLDWDWMGCLLWNYGIWLFLSLETRFQTSERPRDPSSLTRNQRSQGMTNVLNNIDCVPSHVQFSHQEALLYVFEDNEAVIKMIIKGRSPTMRHVSRTHRVALDWLFDRINLDSKIQIKYIDTKNQLADILTKGNPTRDEWNHLVCLFNISHFSSTVCSETMAKRLQQDSGEERVTAKSRPMMSHIARVPSNVSSSTSVNPGKKSYGNQNPWSTIAGERGRIGETRCRQWPKDSFPLRLSSAIYGMFLLSKLLKVGWWPCLVFSRVENWYWDVRATGRPEWNFLESDTRNSTWFLSRGKIIMMEPRNPLWMR